MNNNLLKAIVITNKLIQRMIKLIKWRKMIVLMKNIKKKNLMMKIYKKIHKKIYNKIKKKIKKKTKIKILYNNSN
jgi:coenzyme F420-reducing hydrogenase beta subunit